MVKKDRACLGPISPSIHLHNPGFVWDSEWWDIWHSPCVMIFTEACLRPWTEWKCRCAKDLCVLFWRSLFSRVAFVLKLHADLMKVFVVFSLLNCQGFLDMEKRVCGYFVCVVRCVCVCVCSFPKSCSSPLWSSSDLQCSEMDTDRWKENRNPV